MRFFSITCSILFTFLIAGNSYGQNALSFDGVDDAVDCGNNTLLQITGTAITLEAWIYPTAWTNEVWRGNIIVKEQNSTNEGFMLRAGDNGKLNFAIGGTGPWTELTTVANTLTLNTWQHVAGTYDGDKMRLYVDGIPVDSLSTTVSIGNANTVNMNIGGNIGLSRYFIGSIDEARIWDITRSEHEILNSKDVEQCQQPGLIAYYKFDQGVAGGANAGVTSLADSSGNSLDGTLVNLALSGTVSNWINGVTLLPSGNSTGVGIDVQSGCSPFTWIDGNSYTTDNNTATYTIANAAGCDSTVMLDLTITGNATFSTDEISSCTAILWQDGNLYLTSNNTATYTLTNAAGCDSIITLDLTIPPTTYSTDFQVSCGPFTWIDGSTYSSDNNNATHILTNAAGCDSVITLNLDIATNSGTDVQTACGSFTWIDGNTYTGNNNTATHVLTNSAGCDSTVTLDLTFEPIDISVNQVTYTLTANQAGATYQWLDCDSDMTPIAGETGQTFVATSIGNYAVVVTHYNCVDTSICVGVDAVGLSEVDQELDWIVFPNPTTGTVNIQLGNAADASFIVVKDLTGKVITSVPVANENIVSFDLNVSGGTYFVEVITESGRQVRTFVKY